MAGDSKAKEPRDESSNEEPNPDANAEGYNSADMEYSELNDALDEISSCLDDLERRNEALHRELSKLLESNRQIRQEFQMASA